MKIDPKKIALLVLVLAAIAGFVFFDLGSVFTFENLKAKQASFAAFYAQNRLLTIVVYFLGYIAFTALSLPGAVIMTLGGGALFGTVLGTVLVSFASSIGATCGFLLSRYLFRDAVEARLGDRLKTLNDGIEREGAFYLFTLRLIPVFPFFVINVLMGLTSIRTLTFYWVSQLGMLAGTLVYVNAGTQLGQLESPSGILSPGLIASFVLLGLFPLVAKKAVERARRIYGTTPRQSPS